MLSDNYVRKVRLIRVIDGDTLAVEIDLGWEHRMAEHIRLAGVDTPEIRGAERMAGLKVKNEVTLWLEARKDDLVIQSEEFALGKFGRTIAVVWSGAESLNAWLLERRYGWPTDGEGKIIGARDLGRLAL